jgi:hypothetical protein
MSTALSPGLLRGKSGLADATLGKVAFMLSLP